MRKYMSLILIVVVALLGTLAVSSFDAEARNANNAFEIDDDALLPTCEYNLYVLDPVPPCNKPVKFVDNIPDALEVGIFNDLFYVPGGAHEVECSHDYGRFVTLCVLGDFIEAVPPVTPTPTPVVLVCDEGDIPAVIEGVPQCISVDEDDVDPRVPAFTG